MQNIHTADTDRGKTQMNYCAKYIAFYKTRHLAVNYTFCCSGFHCYMYSFYANKYFY